MEIKDIVRIFLKDGIELGDFEVYWADGRKELRLRNLSRINFIDPQDLDIERVEKLGQVKESFSDMNTKKGNKRMFDWNLEYV